MLFNQILGRCLCIEEPSENLSKTARAECVQIITLSSNDNRKFSMNENVCLNTSEAAEINEHQLNSLTSVIRTSISSSASVSKGNELDCLLYQFVLTHYRVYSIRLSRKVDNHIITALNLYQFVQVAVMYKQKANKIQPMSLFKSNERAPESDSS